MLEAPDLGQVQKMRQVKHVLWDLKPPYTSFQFRASKKQQGHGNKKLLM